MTRLAISVFACALLLTPGSATAVPLGIGDTALAGTTSALRPELAGIVVAEDSLIPYDFTGTGGQHVFGQVQNRVLLAVDGTYDFYWRIIPDPDSRGEITAFRVGGFGNYALDGDFRTDGLGSVGPDTARNFGNGSVNFLFSSGVDPDLQSYFFFLDTDARGYRQTGAYDLLCADSGCVSDAFTTFAPVPEPGTIGLMSIGLAALARRRMRRAHAADA